MARPRDQRIYAKEYILHLATSRFKVLTVRMIEERLPDVSSSTIRRAISELVNEGLLRSVLLVSDGGRRPTGYVAVRK